MSLRCDEHRPDVTGWDQQRAPAYFIAHFNQKLQRFIRWRLVYVPPEGASAVFGKKSWGEAICVDCVNRYSEATEAAYNPNTTLSKAAEN
jgi:hypothetical protein